MASQAAPGVGVSKAVAPITAFIAIGRDNAIDLDLVRRSAAAAQWAAGSIHNRAWPALVAAGWRIEAVTVRLASNEPVSEASEQPGPARLGSARPNFPTPGTRTAPAPPSPAVARSPELGRIKLLRAGEV